MSFALCTQLQRDRAEVRALLLQTLQRFVFDTDLIGMLREHIKQLTAAFNEEQARLQRLSREQESTLLCAELHAMKAEDREKSLLFCKESV